MKFLPLILAGVCVGMSLIYTHADTAEEELSLGMEAMMRYDFAGARTHLNKFKELARKAGETISPSADEALAAIPGAEDMLAGQVEQIVILDSVSTANTDYIEAYSMSRPAGRLFIPSSLEDMGGEWAGMTPFGPMFESEDGTVRYVGVLSDLKDNEEDEMAESQARLYEAVKLDNGVWTDPVALFDEDVDAAFPYMMSDGCTFYFASRSEEGLGGWDIFCSYRDSEDGTFRNPVNIGMPYNSPGDDYMLAIDEYLGVGRWTTERHEDYSDTGEKLDVVYLYIPSEIRKNYDADTPDIKQLAALWTLHNSPADESGDSNIPGYKLTWPEGADYSGLLDNIAAVYEENATFQPLVEDFVFEGPGGKIYTSYDRLPRQARPLMLKYQEALEHQQTGEKELSRLRASYSDTSDATTRKSIDLLQQQVDELRRQTVSARNALFEAFK